MRVLRWLRARLHALVHRDAVAGEIREELELHVRLRTEEYERAGEPPAAAVRHARRRVGNLAVLQDRGYDIRGGGVMETVLQDVRYGVRLLWTQRGFSAVAILTLALGIGLSTALWSVIDAAVLHPLPYPHPEQLVRVAVQQRNPRGRLVSYNVSIDDLDAIASDGRLLQTIAVWKSAYPAPITTGPQPERLDGLEVTEGYFPLFGVSPLLGRGVEAADTRPGAAPVVVLSHGYWQRRYNSDAGVIGQAIRFDTGTATIVGVMPASFDHDAAMWRPLIVTSVLRRKRGAGTVTFARLRAGVTLDQAQRELTARLAREPGATGDQTILLRSLVDTTVGGYETTVGVLAGAVALILLIACVNVAGLLLGRGATRVPELAVRASLGADRTRLIRQLLTESLMLAAVGGLLGVLLAWWSLGALVANLPMRIPEASPVSVNPRVLAFSAGLSMVTGLLFGLLPAFRLSRVQVTGALAKGARRTGSALSRRGGQWLVGAEVALAVVLLAGAGLMLRSFARLSAVDLGFNPDSYLTVEAETVDATPAAIDQYYQAVLERLRALPQVKAAGAIDNLPLSGSFSMGVVKTDDGTQTGVYLSNVMPGYFEAMGLPLRGGRFPTDADRTSGRGVAVVSESAARALFPQGPALGRELTVLDQPAEVVGIVGDIRSDLEITAEPQVYLLFEAGAASPAPRHFTLVVRPSGDARALPGLLRDAAASVESRAIVDRVRTGSAWFGAMVVTSHRRTVLLGLLGALGLVLALIGIFGTTAYAVARRTQEIGVRVALGAQPRDVVWAMLRDVVGPAAVGLAVGLGAATLATRVIASFLFETTPTDPATFAAVAVTLAAAACLAAWIPARRAARVDPVQALRAE